MATRSRANDKVKPGKTQIFTSCELFGITDGVEKLVATGETLLVPVS